MGILVKSAPLNQQYAFLWSSLEIPCPWRCAMWRKITLCRLEITGRLGPSARWTQLSSRSYPFLGVSHILIHFVEVSHWRPHDLSGISWSTSCPNNGRTGLRQLTRAFAHLLPTGWNSDAIICPVSCQIPLSPFAIMISLWLHTAMESFPLSPFTWNCYLLTVESLWCTGHSLLPALSGKAAALTRPAAPWFDDIYCKFFYLWKSWDTR